MTVDYPLSSLQTIRGKSATKTTKKKIKEHRFPHNDKNTGAAP